MVGNNSSPKDQTVLELDQFQGQIKVLQSDNGWEYFNTLFGHFLSVKHNDTPQQNGVAKRKT